jgi:non-ribosomal peptide synthetase component F
MMMFYQPLAAAISMPEPCRRLALDDFSCLPMAGCLPDCCPDAELPLVIQYTSGTTGQPKGVMQSQRMIGWNAINSAVSWKLSADDCALVHTPFFSYRRFACVDDALAQNWRKAGVVACI